MQQTWKWLLSCNLMCIKKKHPDFSPDQLVCPEDVQKLLNEAHFMLLKEALGYTMSE